jgi:UDP-GlcNAc:undecaprenyl-phosphate GlcNAc-1-phosphate transferase
VNVASGAVLALLSFLTSSLFLRLFTPLAKRWRWVDAAGQDPLKPHPDDTPWIGGLGICAGFLVAACGWAVWSRAGAWALALGGGAALCAALLGLLDDQRNLAVRIRLAAEVGIGAALGALGPWTGLLSLPGDSLAFGILTCAFVVGAVNAVNMQDGIDGHAGGLTLVSAAGLAVVGYLSGDPLLWAWGLALVGAISGFLLFNLPPASLFMGDNGSYFLGVVLAALSLRAGFSHPSAALGVLGATLLIGVPVIDAALAIVRRVARRSSPTGGDRDHYYDLLKRRLLSDWRVIAVGCALQLLVVGAGVLVLRGSLQ